jgi:hypothetical protein
MVDQKRGQVVEIVLCRFGSSAHCSVLSLMAFFGGAYASTGRHHVSAFGKLAHHHATRSSDIAAFDGHSQLL